MSIFMFFMDIEYIFGKEVKKIDEFVMVDKSAQRLEIRNLSIADADVCSFFSNECKERDPCEMLRSTIKVGVVGMQRMGGAVDADYIKREFDRLATVAKEYMRAHESRISETIESNMSLADKNSPLCRFNENLQYMFDSSNPKSPLNAIVGHMGMYFDKENGLFKAIMDDYFDSSNGKLMQLFDRTFNIDNKKSSISQIVEGLEESDRKDQESIRDMLSHAKPGSPMHMLSEDINKRFNELRDGFLRELQAMAREILEQVKIDEAVSQERLMGTAKGQDFERYVHEGLVRVTNVFNDDVSDVSNLSGIRGKQGDFVIEVENDPLRRTVVECKDSSSYKKSVKRIRDEIYLAMKNREAAFGIFLFARSEQMPEAMRPFVINDNYMVVSCEDCELCYLYHLARLSTRKNGTTNERDNGIIASEIARISDRLSTIAEIKRQASSVVNSGNYIVQNLDVLEKDIRESIVKMESEIN